MTFETLELDIDQDTVKRLLSLHGISDALIDDVMEYADTPTEAVGMAVLSHYVAEAALMGMEVEVGPHQTELDFN